MPLPYAAQDLLNIPSFYTGCDLYLFVEDTTQTHVYETILKKLCPRLNALIVPCGSKELVTAAFNLFKALGRTDRFLFLLDPDFDALFGRKLTPHKHLLYLERYSIENYFLDEDATAKLIQGRLGCTLASAKIRLNFPTWYNQATTQLHQLTELFAIDDRNHLGLDRRAFGAYTVGNAWRIDPSKVKEYRARIKAHGQKVKITQEDIYVRGKINSVYGRNKAHIIPGKFLLDCLRAYIATMGYGYSTKDLVNFIIREFDHSQLDFLKRKIDQL